MSIPYPKTAAEWWHNFDLCKYELRKIVANYHPGNNRRSTTARITAGAAEAVCASIGADIAKETTIPPLEAFDAAAGKRDALALVTILNQAWFGVPESTDCWQIPAFGVLCDLASEASTCLGGDDE